MATAASPPVAHRLWRPRRVLITRSARAFAHGREITARAAALEGAPNADLTVELITHRFTAGSKTVLGNWYPGSALDLGFANRTTKRTKFGSIKHVYDAGTMRQLRGFFEGEIARVLPQARILYLT